MFEKKKKLLHPILIELIHLPANKSKKKSTRIPFFASCRSLPLIKQPD